MDKHGMEAKGKSNLTATSAEFPTAEDKDGLLKGRSICR